MLQAIARVLGHRAAGWVGCAVAIGLAGAFAVTTGQARREEAVLRARIGALASQDAAQTQAELVSCRATVRSYAAAMAASAQGPAAEAPSARPIQVARREDPRAVAAELAANPPAGLDVCARMESADQAVLKTLGRR